MQKHDVDLRPTKLYHCQGFNQKSLKIANLYINTIAR